MKKVVLYKVHNTWNWHALASNGKILAGTNQGYARRGTAVKYMESVTNAKHRGIPVWATNGNGMERLY